MQIILGQLDKMKQRYLAYRRHQGDTTDVFARKKTVEKALVGPSPFAELSNLNVLALAQIQSQQQAQQQPQAATQANNTATATTGGLFGNTSANTGGGLFGNTSSNATGGLFGNARFVQDSCFTVKSFTEIVFFSKPATGGGLFGNTSTSATGGGLFGNTTGAAKPASSFSFGNTTQATTAQVQFFSFDIFW